ncbi:MAG: hypothetical protein JNM57_03860 [Cyclobacteriaceae bacterium]|nr:hypothetical protein [Cyclobacteriaceae bacterium]
MVRTFLCFFGLSMALGACTQRMVCPAYQSAFIYDKEELRKKFSYFQEDSTPKILTASKNKYLVAEPVTYRKKIRSMQTVEMKQIPVKVPDSLTMDGDVSLAELDMAARSVMDTIMASGYQKRDTTQVEEDSVYVITKDKELRLLKYNPDSLKYSVVDVRLNVDQDNYMWYLRNYLILPDVRLAKQQQQNAKEEGKSSKSKKGVKGFFKNLFKKKKATATDSTSLVAPVRSESEFDYVDDEEGNVKENVALEEKKEKKGAFSFLKKKDKAQTTGDQLPSDKPAKKKKEKKQKKADVVKPEEATDEKEDGF